jgi:hypothetical protein
VGQIVRDQPRAQSRCRQAQSRIDVVQRAEYRAGRVHRPVRRPQPLHPAAFLVDQHGRFPADDVAE